MERIIKLKIEKLPEGCCLAASEDIQGLVAQGRTIAETIEIARDVAKKLSELQGDKLPQQEMTQIELPDTALMLGKM